MSDDKFEVTSDVERQVNDLARRFKREMDRANATKIRIDTGLLLLVAVVFVLGGVAGLVVAGML
jgi:hypothetical protein